MKSRVFVLLGLVGLFNSVTSAVSSAAEADAPVITDYRSSNTLRAFKFSLHPAIQSYSIETKTNLNGAFVADPSFFLATYTKTNFTTNSVTTTNGPANVIITNIQTFYEWRRTNLNFATPSFHRVVATPLSSNAALAATVLNRLTYGPTPDEIDRITSIGPDAYIAEQLAPWTLTEDVELTHTNIPFYQAKLAAADEFVAITNASLSEFRAWHQLRAIGAKRQLLEILLQFWENHFVTQYSKSANDFFDTYYDNGNYQNRLGTHFEYLENLRWRNALLNPQCSFYDLLKISAESPAQIIYLDTVDSRSDGSNVANENYAREVLELFTFGVDNGYDQTDITVQSPIWTGWRIEKVDFTNYSNPFALATAVIIPGSTNPSTTIKSNLYGAWAFNYKTNFHNTATRTIFSNKVVNARFGAPWTSKLYGTNLIAGRYQIGIPGHGRTSTNGIEEGYQFINHIADLPFTQEYISIKLCRLLVHDEFPNPSNDTNSPAYSFYNYAAGNLTPEAQLVKACMLTWETNSPRGQIWKVVKTITDSELFRTQAAAQQKIKTPLEFTVSAIRALRSSTNGSNLFGSYTAFTDGLALNTPLQRIGNMLLFDRDAPDGYPEAGPPWVSAGTLAERIRWVQSYCIANGQSGHSGDAGNSMCDIVGLLRAKTPSTTWTNAPAVADYFLGLLYPGEGAGNLAYYRKAAIDFLNNGSADSDFSPDYRNTPLAGIPVTNTANQPYDERVRGMVALLMSLHRFQEQ